MMRRQKQINRLAKLSAYILGRRPDEFGLVPDTQGYVKIKAFLRALNETDGFKHIRQSHINEMQLVLSDPPVEIHQSRIRATDRSRLYTMVYCKNPPKTLYTCITQKSYPTVIDKGVRPTSYSHVVCSVNRDMAEKIGRRRDNHPVLLTIQVKKAVDLGIKFKQAGDLIFLAGFIPPECLTGPPLPKHTESITKTAPVAGDKQKAGAGSFMLLPGRQAAKKNDKAKRVDADWKKNKKRLRRQKKKLWPP